MEPTARVQESFVRDESDRFHAILTPHAVSSLPVGGWGFGLAAFAGQLDPWLGLAVLLGVAVLVCLLLLWETLRWRLTCTPEGIAVTREVLGFSLDVQRWPHEAITSFAAVDDPCALVVALTHGGRWRVRVTDRPSDLRELASRLEEARAQNARRWREQLTADARRDRAALGRLLERDR